MKNDNWSICTYKKVKHIVNHLVVVTHYNNKCPLNPVVDIRDYVTYDIYTPVDLVRKYTHTFIRQIIVEETALQ